MLDIKHDGKVHMLYKFASEGGRVMDENDRDGNFGKCTKEFLRQFADAVENNLRIIEEQKNLKIFTFSIILDLPEDPFSVTRSSIMRIYRYVDGVDKDGILLSTVDRKRLVIPLFNGANDFDKVLIERIQCSLETDCNEQDKVTRLAAELVLRSISDVMIARHLESEISVAMAYIMCRWDPFLITSLTSDYCAIYGCDKVFDVLKAFDLLCNRGRIKIDNSGKNFIALSSV